jgi:hypothetical protein
LYFVSFGENKGLSQLLALIHNILRYLLSYQKVRRNLVSRISAQKNAFVIKGIGGLDAFMFSKFSSGIVSDLNPPIA